jgi:hypothetical protein
MPFSVIKGDIVAGDANAQLDLLAVGADGEVLIADSASPLGVKWQAGAGGGEINTASNVGTAGVGVFKSKVGVDLRFKKINSGSAKVTITDDTGNDEIDIDVPDATTSAKGAVELATDGENAAGVVVQGNDSRLSDSRTPTAHSHAASDITSGTIPTAQLGSGTADDNAVLLGDSTWLRSTTADHVVQVNSDGTALVIDRVPDHKSQHQSGGVDPIKLDDLDTPDDNTDLNATTGRHGLLRKLDNDPAHYLDGQGNWTTPPIGPTVCKLTSDAAGITSTTMVNITGLSFSVASSGYYHFKFVVRYTSSNTLYGAGFAINGPAGGTVALLAMVGITNAASGTPTMRAANAYNTPNAAIGLSTNDTNAQIAIIEGIYYGGGTAGTLQLRGATENASGTITPKTGSCGLLHTL